MSSTSELADRKGVYRLVVAEDAYLIREGIRSALEREDAGIEVAWGTSDLFDDGPIRPFFGLLRRAETLRWFQSAAAGYDTPIFAELVRNGVALTTSDANSISIAEYVLRCVLEHFQESARWAEALLSGGDAIEILTPRQGG